MVARHIYDNSLGGKAKVDYVDSLWNNEQSFWKVLFDSKLYFIKQLDIEIHKLEGRYGDISSSTPAIIPDDIPIGDLTLNEIKERDPNAYRRIKDTVFTKYTAEKFIRCAASNFKSQSRNDFQIDHIKPMSQGGKTVLDNLQVLSRKAHTEKTTNENKSSH